MQTHTPAPWTATAYPDQYRVDGPDGTSVLIIRTGLIPTREDARLIAAAPDLLAVLKQMVWLQAGDQIGTSDVMAIRAAIAKATGGDQ